MFINSQEYSVVTYRVDLCRRVCIMPIAMIDKSPSVDRIGPRC